MTDLSSTAFSLPEVTTSVLHPPLVLDLDGTLIRNDLTFELCVLCARWRPILLFRILFIAIFDRGRAKRILAEHFADYIDPETLPYESDVLRLVRKYKESGRSIELVSGSDEQIVAAIARKHNIACFKGSKAGLNLIARRKADYLTARHGSNFLYVGNAKSDFAVWRAGRGGYGVNAPAKSYALTAEDGSRVQISELVPRRNELRALVKSLRLHQWAKNLLLLIVPALQIIHLSATDGLKLLAAFFCFSLLASATYLINDLFDIQDDRRHRSKRLRPLADGMLSIPIAITFVVVILPSSLFTAFLIDRTFGAVLFLYLIITTLYSFGLKRLAIVDVFTLASLFSIRVIAGAFLIEYPPSGWLLSFIGCFFLSLAIGKRYVELLTLDGKIRTPGRGYLASDVGPLLASGAGSGMIAVLAMLIYGLSAPVTVFNSESAVLLGCGLLLAWIMRFWLLAGRREISDDPVVYAIRDRTSLTLLGMISFFFALDLTSPLWISLF